jgi:transcription antitermination protein NusB
MSRNKARIIAMQALFQLDKDADSVWLVIEDRLEEESLDDNDLAYLNNIATQVINHLTEIDSFIIKYTIDWDISRLGKVERSILRLSIGEMLYAGDIPPSVAINEAVRLAKKFGAEQAAKFINGILGKFCREQLEGEKDK